MNDLAHLYDLRKLPPTKHAPDALPIRAPRSGLFTVYERVGTGPDTALINPVPDYGFAADRLFLRAKFYERQGCAVELFEEEGWFIASDAVTGHFKACGAIREEEDCDA